LLTVATAPKIKRLDKAEEFETLRALRDSVPEWCLEESIKAVLLAARKSTVASAENAKDAPGKRAEARTIIELAAQHSSLRSLPLRQVNECQLKREKAQKMAQHSKDFRQFDTRLSLRLERSLSHSQESKAEDGLVKDL